jgi:hypothetical protein
MPVYHESVVGFSGRLSAMRAALCDATAHFDIFVLSDSRDPVLLAEELAAVLRLRALPGPAPFGVNTSTTNEPRMNSMSPHRPIVFSVIRPKDSLHRQNSLLASSAS